MDKQNSVTCPRREALPALIATVAGACILYAVMTAAAPLIADNAVITDFGTMLVGCMQGVIPEQVHWFFADMSETTFLASAPASVGLVVGALIAAHLEVKGSRMAGTGVDGNGAIYGRLTIASLASVALGIIFFGHVWPGFTGWIPTFAVLLVVQPLIIQFGATPSKLVTCIVLSTFTAFPVAYWLQLNVATPLGVPLFVAVSMAVVIVTSILTAVCNVLPWMKSEPTPVPVADETQPTAKPAEKSSVMNFFINRAFGDIGELAVTGSSISTIGMYIGAIIAWFMNPLEPAYGAGNLPLLIASQIIVAAVAIFIYYPDWKSQPFVFSFPGVVFVSAIVGGYCATGTATDFIIAIPTIIIGAIIFVPIINFIMKTAKFQGKYPAIILIQCGIFPAVILWALLLNNAIVPML